MLTETAGIKSIIVTAMLFMMMCVKLGSFTLFKLEVKVRVNVKKLS